MSRASSRLPKLVAVTLVLSFVAGCGGPTPVPLSGKVVLPSGVKLADTDSVTVVFVPEEGDQSKGENATLSPKDLSFSAKVVPGKYKIAVNVQIYPGSAGAMKETNAKNKELSLVFGSFSSGSTPLHYEVTKEANQTITLNLDKKTVGK